MITKLKRPLMHLIFYGLLGIPFLPACAQSLPIDTIRLPAGFHIGVFAARVPGARSLTLGSDGTVYVGSRREGKVYAVVDRNGDGVADDVRVIATGLNSPNGVAYRNGDLYIAEIGRISRIKDVAKYPNRAPLQTIFDNLPGEAHHGWRYMRFGPDGKLYIAVGAPCNICNPDPRRYAGIFRLNPDGSGFERYAQGVRNSVGFDWRPGTDELWFTDNGRDWMGDDRPPDELNRAPQQGLHFGYPHCHGRAISDPEFGQSGGCSRYVAPAVELGPHVATLGMRFYTGEAFPKSYREQIFIAEHGSWNRSTPIGYRITLVRLNRGQPVSYETFAEGWLRGGEAWGRPVDVEVMPDGSLLVSDDKAGAIYRITYKP